MTQKQRKRLVRMIRKGEAMLVAVGGKIIPVSKD